jgi:hypothetical protein
VDTLNVEIDKLNDLLVEFCFIRSIDKWGPRPLGPSCVKKNTTQDFLKKRIQRKMKWQRILVKKNKE